MTETAAGTDQLLVLSDSLRAAYPEQVERLDAISRTAWQRMDPALLELVRLRIASLIGHPRAGVRSSWVAAAQLSDEKVDRLADWPSSELFDQRDRDCLAFTEQFVMDVSSLTDADVAAAARHFETSDFYAFVNAVWVMDLGQRLEIVSAALGRQAS